MSRSINAVRDFVLKNSTIVLFVALFVFFGVVAPRFFSGKNITNIFSNASYIGIVGVGMTFVLLTGGIDLSVGSTMYVSAVVAGLVVNQLGLPIGLGLAACLLVGLVFGLINAFIITRLNVVPFIATLTTMLAGRGFGLMLTKSVAVNFPDSLTLLATVDVFGFFPIEVVIFLAVVFAAALYLRSTTGGRRIYAVGNDIEIAKKAGIRTTPVVASTYVICALCAALGGFISIAEMGRVNADFGKGEEFNAIAAAVLGGASLFGGIGTVFPGTLLGTVMIQMIQAGLVFSNVDVYKQEIVKALMIFLAVFIDSLRNSQLRKLGRRTIMRVSDSS